MIDKELLHKTVADAIEGSGLFLVEISVKPGNEITVEVDSAEGVDIEQCTALTRAIEAVFDRDVEDYELEVGSAGLTSPLKIRAQYEKNLGNDVEVLTRDGRKLRGVLSKVAGGDGADRDVDFTIETSVKVKEPGMKKPEMRIEPVELKAADCKYVRYDLKF